MLLEYQKKKKETMKSKKKCVDYVFGIVFIYY